MILPTVHLNGTHVDDLIMQAELARLALGDALDKMSEMYPNGRYYYPQGSGAITIAISEHSARVLKIKAIFEEIGVLLEHLYGERELREAGKR